MLRALASPWPPLGLLHCHQLLMQAYSLSLDSAANCKESSFTWISTQIPYLSLVSEFHMKPKIAFSHLYFGAFCNLVFLNPYPLFFLFLTTLFFLMFSSLHTRTTFSSWNRTSFMWKSHDFFIFSDTWGFLSRRISLLSHNLLPPPPPPPTTMYFIICPTLLSTSFSSVTFISRGH